MADNYWGSVTLCTGLSYVKYVYSLIVYMSKFTSKYSTYD